MIAVLRDLIPPPHPVELALTLRQIHNDCTSDMAED